VDLVAPGVPANLAVDGAHAFLASRWRDPDWARLYVVDVSTPSAPTAVGTTWLGNAGGIKVAGSYAFVAGGTFQVVGV